LLPAICHFPQVKVLVILCGCCLNSVVFRLEGLDDDLSVAGAVPGPSCNLKTELECPLTCAIVGN